MDSYEKALRDATEELVLASIELRERGDGPADYRWERATQGWDDALAALIKNVDERAYQQGMDQENRCVCESE